MTAAESRRQLRWLLPRFQALRRPVASLRDLAAAVLAEFGIEGFPTRGR